MSPSSPSSPSLSRRRWLQAAALGVAAPLLLTGAGCSPITPAPGASSQPSRLRLIGEASLPHHMPFQNTTVGGLSGIDYDPVSGLYALISDDRSVLNPARFYTARLPLSPAGLGTPELQHAVTLLRADGTPFPSQRQAKAYEEVPDAEAIRWTQGGTLLWTSEGAVSRGQGPGLYESRTDGSLVRQIPLPAMFQANPGGGTGPRDNQTLEGLALTPDGHTAWLAMEGALVQDGPLPTLQAAGGPCRITAIDLASGQAMRQIAYVPDPIPSQGLLPGVLPPVIYADNGISEVLMQDAHHMLVLERAYAFGQGTSLRLYRIDTRAGSDTLALPQLTPGNHQPSPKTLVADFATLGLSRLDNTEGMTWGPVLQHGSRSSRTLVFVSDDNFRSAQVTQFAAFEFIE